jgi:hypothetical protein
MTHSKPTILATALIAAHMGMAAYAQAPAPADDPSDTGTTTMDPAMRSQSPTSPSRTDPARPGTATTPSTTTGTTDMDADTDMTGDRPSATTAMDSELPSTATPLWLLGLANGLGLAGLAAGLRIVRRSRRV